jgi:hypothetical protein
MNQEITSKLKANNSGKKHKAATQTAMENVWVAVGVLINGQIALAQQSKKNENSKGFLIARIEALGESLPNLFDSLEKLSELIFSSHPGGRPSNPYFNIAYKLLKKNYIATKKIMKAKELCRAVCVEVCGDKNHTTEDGVELFPERKAQQCIWLFKVSLPHEDFGHN